MNERALKKEIVRLLKNGELDAVLAMRESCSAKRMLNLLIGCFCNDHELVRWLAVTGVGNLVVALADNEMEDGRVVMRRFMWMLNDESGGIGWGAPEAMGEVMACHRRLAEEYGHMLVANMREDGNFLELEMLQRGLMWGIGRLAEVRPELLREKNAVRYLLPYLDSGDPTVRGLACRALGNLKAVEAKGRLSGLTGDEKQISVYADRSLEQYSVGHLAARALERIG
ncbi:MAG: HEAT repeat domain-containing protein [Proteobacteria bacterium]|nr:HEAT repeat domain-containing protein [Pseudomonadota bacterium]MBU1737925.1 HEAT repeat domain-containing protein [Pseudomonadota bacterium]